MTLYEAFIMTCHTGYVCDQSFCDEDTNLTQDFLDKAAQLLKRDVYLEEFMIEPEKVLLELKKASYDEWMIIVKGDKE